MAESKDFLFFLLTSAVIYENFFQRLSHNCEMSKVKSEDVLGEKWDRCLADTSIKMLGGQ